MVVQEDLRPTFKRSALDIMRRLSGPEREALLIKCWMSYDARWFMTVAAEYGMQVANRLNKVAAHEAGKAEARRILRALQLPPVTALDDILRIQEVLIGLLGPDLVDYSVTKAGDGAYRVHVHRCFANENVERAGIAEDYECGIFARITGWLDALDLDYKTTPSLDKCLKARGQECVYTLGPRQGSPSPFAQGQES